MKVKENDKNLWNEKITFIIILYINLNYYNLLKTLKKKYINYLDLSQNYHIVYKDQLIHLTKN